MGILSDLASEYRGSGFQIYGVVADVMGANSYDLQDAAAVFSGAGGRSFTNMAFSQSLGSAMMGDVSVVPTTKFFDSDGRLLTTVIGAKSKNDWINLIETVMYEKA